MQGSAKRSRHIMFKEEALVSFGNYLLSRYKVQEYSTDGANVPLFQRQVSDADYQNWLNEYAQKKGPGDHVLLPSRYDIGQPVWLCLWSHKIIAEVLCVHFYEGKVKYDLNLLGEDGDTTRIYNVDSFYVKDKVQEETK